MSCETCGRGVILSPTIFGRKICKTCLIGVSAHNGDKFNQWLANRVSLLSKRKAAGLSIVYCEQARWLRYNVGLRFCKNFAAYVDRYNRQDWYLCEKCYTQTQVRGFNQCRSTSDWRSPVGLTNLREPRQDWRARHNRMMHEAFARGLEERKLMKVLDKLSEAYDD